MDKQITIRMPKELLAKWLAALRSGEYGQCKSRLQGFEGYCCLGVLQHVASGDVERDQDGESVALPSDAWLAKHSVWFDGSMGAPYLPAFQCMAYTANDSRGHTFPEIAAAIEACAEGV